MTSQITVLIVEDEEPILKFLRASLLERDFRVLEAGTGRLAIELAAARKPDVILLDLWLPDLDGLEVLKRLRQWTEAPVIILSARGTSKPSRAWATAWSFRRTDQSPDGR